MRINANYRNKWENATAAIARKISRFLIIKCVLFVPTGKIWDEKKGKRWKEDYCNTFTWKIQ